MTLSYSELDGAMWDEARAVAVDFPDPTSGGDRAVGGVAPLEAGQVPGLVPTAARSLVEGLPPYVI